MTDPGAPAAPNPTLNPGETIRSERSATAPPALPSISVDLRELSPTVGDRRTDLEVRGVIGEGGMGRVLLARQHSLARDVAVKTARPDASPAVRAALLAEGAVTGQLEHPAIVPVHALGLDASGWPALVMKRVEGVSWDALLADPAHPGWEGWEGEPSHRLAGHLQILTSVCNALHFAHSREVVHRDVKPQNVLIGRFGDVYLADWGVAAERGSTHTQVCGTPAYLAPEMVQGGTVDERTDVYLLGATLHAVLTGQPRHPGSSITEALAHARSSLPFAYAPEVPAELAALANRACHPDPAQRPQSARDFRDQLALYLRHRNAVALGEQAQARLVELEALSRLPEGDAPGRQRSERLLAEARFGLEQSLAQWADNAPAQAALARVEAILDQRHRRALALEAESRERDPRRGGRWRTVGLAMMTVLAAGAALVASTVEGEPDPVQLVIFPAVVTFFIAAGALSLRAQLLGTRFNREVFGGVLIGMGFMVFSRGLAALVPVPTGTLFSRDALGMAGAMAMLALTHLRWLWIISGSFAATGLLCALYPAASLPLFSGATVVAMVVSTVVSWLESRKPHPPR